MKIIELTQGRFALVDDEDYERLCGITWYAHKRKGIYYAGTNVKIGHLKYRCVQMHRLILSAPKGIDIDHRDHNGLNNQKSNLRFATPAQNKANSKKSKINKSGFKGVYRRENGKWRAKIGVNRKIINLGTFEQLEQARNAYNEAAKKYYGEFAYSKN